MRRVATTLFAFVLTFLAFAEALVFDPGDGNVTNVAGYIRHTVDGVTVASGTVNLMSDLNVFTGDVTVNEGATLGLASLSSTGRPSSLGYAERIVLAPGTTLRYLGAGAGSANVSLTFDAAAEGDVLTVDSDGDFAFLGAMSVPQDSCGRFVKTGSGTFTIGTTALPEGETNYLARAETDSPYAIDVQEGGVAIATGEDVTTVLGSKAYTYLNDKNETRWAYRGRTHVGAENKSAHLDIVSGNVFLAERLFLGAPGATTALNMYGGSLKQIGSESYLMIGDIPADDISAGKDPGDSSLNLYGGYLRIQYVAVTPRRGTKGRIYLSGGTLEANIYAAHDTDNVTASFDDPLVPEAEIYVCTNGYLNSRYMQLARSGLSRVRMTVADGGTLAFGNQGLLITKACDGEILLDGGNLRLATSRDPYLSFPQEGSAEGVTFKIGAKTSTVTAVYDMDYTIAAPVVSGVTGGTDGGLAIRSSGTGTVRFTGATSYTGPTYLASGACLRLSSDLALASLVASEDDIALRYDVSGATMPLLTVGGFDVPGTVRLTLTGSLDSGTYDILSAPESATVDPARFVLAEASDALGARFEVRVSGGRKIVSLTTFARTHATSSWTAPAGGAWETAGNWTAAPASSTETRVNFATAAAAQDNAVTLAAPFTLGGMTLSANPGYAISGAALTLDNAGSTAKVLATAGTNTLATPISVTGAASFGTTNGATLNLSGVISGGQVTVNPDIWPYSSGTVRLSGANTFPGRFRVVGGKAVVTSIANAGIASPVGAGSAIEIGKGAFSFAGGVGSTDRTIILNAVDTYRMPAIDVAEGSALTLTGPIEDVMKGLHKRGKGTLTLNGPYDYAFDARSYSLKSAWDVYFAWGDAMPPIGGIVVTSGTLEIGPAVGAVTMPDDFVIGTRTTDKVGEETGAEVVVNGGETTVDGYVIIGHDNGMLTSGGALYTGETSVLTNRLTLNAGLVTAKKLDLGYQYYKTSRQLSELVVNGGTFTVLEYSRIGVNANSFDGISTARIVVNGGMVDLSGSAFIGANDTAPTVEIEINGGVYKADQFRYSWPSVSGQPHVTTVNEGGALRINGTVSCAATPRNIGSHLLFDGGTYQPMGTSPQLPQNTSDQQMNVQIGAKGAVFDTTYVPAGFAAAIRAVSDGAGGGNWSTQPGVTTDGGIRVIGPASADRAVIFTDAAGYGFNGPVVLDAGGVALAKTTALDGKAVTVKAGGAFGSHNTVAAHEETPVASLTLEDGATLIAGFRNATYRGTVRATGSLTQAGTVYVLASQYQSDYRYGLYTTAGTYPVVRGPVGSLDATKFALSPRYAASSVATFALVHGDGYDEVKMTLTSASPYVPPVPPMVEKTWTASTGGSWLDPDNWDYVPADTNTDHIVFPNTLTAPATISLGGERTFGLLSSSVNGDVTLTDGSLKLKELETYTAISNTCGTLTLPAMTGPTAGSSYAIRLEPSVGATQIITGPISSPSRIFGNSKRGYGGTIRIASPQTTWLETYSGTVEGVPEDFGTATYIPHKSTFRFTEGGDSHATVAASDGLHLHADGDVFSLGKISNGVGPFIKTGKGTVYLLSDAEARLSTSANATPSDATTMAWQLPANGDIPDGVTDGNRLACGNIVAGKLVLGLTGATTRFGGHARLGCSLAEFDENGDVLDAEIEVRGGKVIFENDLYIARNAGFYRQYHDSAKRRKATFSLYDGEVNITGTYMAHDATGYFNGDAILNVYGGLMKSTGSYIIFNAHRTSKMTDNGQSHSYINIYGGMFTNTYYAAANDGEVDSGKRTGGLSTHVIQSADFDLNLFGGDFAWTSALTADANASTKARLNLAGGRLTARYVRRNSANGTVGFFWNGGIYQPTRNGATMKGRVVENGADVRTVGKDWSYNTCSTNGAYFQIPAGNTFTLDQALTHDADLGDTADGGLASIGAGTLVLGVANTFTGPVKAISGTMQVDADGAVPAGVDLELSGGTLDLNSHNVTVRNVTGSGGWARNGTVTVTGAISVAGGADAWVGMDAAVFGDETVFTPNYSYSEATGTWTGDYLKFGGAATGKLAVDLRRTAENPLPVGFRLKIAELPAAAAAPALRVLNWGDNPKASVMFSRNVEGETAEIYVEVIPKGTAIVFR